ncbi:CAP domain-containing protein [Bacillus suaedaesalsae]|uniref:SCP domain-containing protein n=1 Tax=Bacillus suaedaesalsae TaxID=2810349 RepID=A0ABS2DEY3_9BACI|nr:CAP domain-containing protein [Bacillus suaedaesalsae]MBM6617020.1 hypothetical protein [Bacillus suaedaesalsae]
MNSIYKSIISGLLVVGCLTACNNGEESSADRYDTRNDFLNSEDVNYQSGNSRTNADGKLARSTVTYNASGHQTKKISYDHKKNMKNQGQQKYARYKQPTNNTGVTNQNTPAPAPAPNATVGTNNNQQGGYIQQVVDLTNRERSNNGLPPIAADVELQKAAQMKSDDMATNNYFSHTSPTYGSPFDMLRNLGIEYKVAAENIAQGQRSPQEVVTAWMNSEGHRKNILNKDITHIGVGHAASGNYWTQLFIKK